MRHYRMGLIQTPDQLRFSYQAILEGAERILDSAPNLSMGAHLGTPAKATAATSTAGATANVRKNWVDIALKLLYMHNLILSKAWMHLDMYLNLFASNNFELKMYGTCHQVNKEYSFRVVGLECKVVLYNYGIIEK